MSAPKKLSDTEFALSNRLAEVDKMLFATRAERDALAARVERLEPIVRELAEWQPVEVNDIVCRARAALAETQEG